MNYGSILLNIIIHLFKWRQYQQNPKRAKGLAVGETLVLDPICYRNLQSHVLLY